MKIQLVDTRVVKLSIDRLSPDTLSEDDRGNLKSFSVKSGFPINDDKNYIICFELELVTECSMLMRVEYEAYFETDDIITDEFKTSPFVAVNSPAIAYPYLRAYVGTVLTLSGFASIILPTMNFQAMYKAAKEQEG